MRLGSKACQVLLGVIFALGGVVGFDSGSFLAPGFSFNSKAASSLFNCSNVSFLKIKSFFRG